MADLHATAFKKNVVFVMSNIGIVIELLFFSFAHLLKFWKTYT